jgi:outer membrane autotransporter protein
LAPAYEVLARNLLMLNELPTMQQRIGNRSWLRPGDRSHIASDKKPVWLRVDGSERQMNSNRSTTDSRYNVLTGQVQVGADIPVADNDLGVFYAGLSGSYRTIRSNVKSPHSPSNLNSTGYSVGVTGTWYGHRGEYVDLQGLYTWSRNDISVSGVGSNKNIKGTAQSASVEAGKQIVIVEERGISVTPQAQVRYTHADINGADGPFGERIGIKDAESVVGRLGATVDLERNWGSGEKKHNRLHTYAIANVNHEFVDQTKVRVSGVNLSNTINDWSVSYGAGVSVNLKDGKYLVHAEVLRAHSLEDPGDNTATRANVGFSIHF